MKRPITPELLKKCEDLMSRWQKTLDEFNSKVDTNLEFDPTVKDGKSSMSSGLSKSNWAQNRYSLSGLSNQA